MSTVSGETVQNYSIGDADYDVVRAADGYHVVDRSRGIDITAGEPFASQPLAADVMALAQANEEVWTADEAADEARKAA